MKTKDASGDRLFPELPEGLSGISDEDLTSFLREHEAAAELIKVGDEEFLDGLNAEEIVAELKVGAEQTQRIRDALASRAEGQEEFRNAVAELADAITGSASEEDGDEGAEAQSGETLAEETDGEGDGAEGDGTEEGDGAEGDGGEEAAAADVVELSEKRKVALRRPPSPSAERRAAIATHGTPLLAAAGLQEVRSASVMNRKEYARAIRITAERRGRPTKSANGVEERILIASANFPFPPDRQLRAGDLDGNADKIGAVIPGYIPGVGRFSGEALVASGGLCAPLEPIYTMPNFASPARPVRDSLPTFQADRGGVNVPAASYIGDIDTAITVITEAEDALGGTFATKSCQDLDCPTFTEVPVTVVSHCREYGNLNAMAWPEKIAHENDLTMAAHSRTADTYLLQRIKALSINVTDSVAATLNAYAALVSALERATSATRFRLRMEPSAQFRALLPAWLPDLLVADAAFNQFDRYQVEAGLIAQLARLGISVTWHLDSVAGEAAATDFAAEVGGTSLDDFPNQVEYAVYAEGAFIHVDSGSLELGLVRDSTLNSTNDFQLFGETFENVALLGPAQSALWIKQDICPNGVFPALGTAITCS